MTNPTRQKIESREEVLQKVWNAHLKSPTFALSEALRQVETRRGGEGEGRGGGRGFHMSLCLRGEREFGNRRYDLFSQKWSGVYHFVVRAGLYCCFAFTASCTTFGV